MAERNLELLNAATFGLAEAQPERMQPLLDHVADSIAQKAALLEQSGQSFEVFGPEWCYDNPDEAGKLHADVIIGAYGATYALPNKDPATNAAALRDRKLDMYLMAINGEVTGTTCLVNMGNGVAELGRSASRGRTSNSIIQDLRIFDWLTNDQTAQQYHSLFTTLRTAPNRHIPDASGEAFVMRGGQAVTEHWRKFPTLTVSGFAPMYLKQGKLEQFSYATLTNAEYDPHSPIYVGNEQTAEFVRHWHDHYNLALPEMKNSGEEPEEPGAFAVHYPPQESGLTGLVHADIEAAAREESDKSLQDCIAEADQAGSPVTQILLPITHNTLAEQSYLQREGFVVYGYVPATNRQEARLLYSRVRPGTHVVPTAWNHHGESNPFWKHDGMEQAALAVEAAWTLAL